MPSGEFSRFCRNTLTKNPSVSVRRGVISKPFVRHQHGAAEQEGALAERIRDVGGRQDRKFRVTREEGRTCAPFSSSSTEQVT